MRRCNSRFIRYIKIPTAKRSLGNGKWEGGLLVPIDYAIAKRR